MTDITQLARQASVHLSHTQKNKQAISPLPGLTLLSTTEPSGIEATVYDPIICLILQGAKETTLGQRTVRFAAGESLIVSHSLPVVSQITAASVERPYIALILSIDLKLLRELYHEIDTAPIKRGQARSLQAGQTDPDLTDALTRYLAMAEQPATLKVLGSLVLKEIHFRLLMAEHGAMLRKLLNHESHASQISRSINHIRSHFRSPLAMPELAKTAGMSVSAFYEHFKNITETTPLQYQKELRLIEAQRLLRQKRQPVSSVAFDVGYESPTQFSREYSRKFGMPPKNEQLLPA